VTAVIGLAAAIEYVYAPRNRSRGHMQDTKDKRKKEPDHAETQSLDEQVLHSAGGDATRRIRTFVQDLERFLKDEKRRP